MSKSGSTVHLVGGGGFGNPCKLMVSTDNGVTFTELSALANIVGTNAFGQPASAFSLHVNGDDIYVGASNDASNDPINLWYSADAGATFTPDTVGLGPDANGTSVPAKFYEAGGYLFMAASFKDVYRKGQSVGVAEEVANEIKVYPNPATDLVMVEGCDDAPFVLRDLTGREIVRGNLINGSIDLSEMTDGVYLLQKEKDGVVGVSRIVIHH